MARGSGGKRLTDEIFARLRADVLAGRLTPGQKLRINLLATQFGVSQIVVREALTRLAEQGLARVEPQLGFSVIPLSRPYLMDLTKCRIQIETLALRQAVEQASVEWEATVLASHHILDNTPLGVPEDPRRLSDAWADAHRHFHETLTAGCGSPILDQIMRSLSDAAEIYRRWAHPASRSDRDIPSEHRAIVAATLGHDADRACRLLTQHYQLTCDNLLASWG